MPSLPSSLSLTTIANGAALTSSPVRNNFSDTQTAVNALITALASGSSKQVLTSGGSSSVAFVQMLRGSVTGTTGAVASGSGFTCSRTGAGRYTVTFTSAFTAAPTVVATITGGAADATIGVTSITTTGCVVAINNLTPVAADKDFNFIALEV